MLAGLVAGHTQVFSFI